MSFALKTVNFALKMVNFVIKSAKWGPKAPLKTPAVLDREKQHILWRNEDCFVEK